MALVCVCSRPAPLKKFRCEPFCFLKYLIYRSGLTTIFVVYPKIVVVCRNFRFWEKYVIYWCIHSSSSFERWIGILQCVIFFCKKEGKEDEKGTNYKVDGKFVYCDGFFGSCSNIRIDKFYMLPFFVSAGITGRCRKITS